jgi:Kyakuja-Dileera-Zisupton transposase
MSSFHLLKWDSQLPGEAPLEVSVIGVLDGNQSLKRVHHGESREADPRRFSSDYYITEASVDRFKHDVKPRPLRTPKKLVCPTVYVHG